MSRDEKDISNHKKRMIEDIKKINKTEMFKQNDKKEKLSFMKRLLIIFGYGKKR